MSKQRPEESFRRCGGFGFDFVCSRGGSPRRMSAVNQVASHPHRKPGQGQRMFSWLLLGDRSGGRGVDRLVRHA